MKKCSPRRDNIYKTLLYFLYNIYGAYFSSLLFARGDTPSATEEAAANIVSNGTEETSAPRFWITTIHTTQHHNFFRKIYMALKDDFCAVATTIGF